MFVLFADRHDLAHDFRIEASRFRLAIDILDIVGDGPHRGDYESLCQELGLDDCVTFHGMRNKAEVATYMKGCDFFVMPSQYEGFGVVYAEAMATGKPIIATNTRGPDEVVTSEAGILVDPGSRDALEEAIRYMLDNHQSYEPERIAALAQARYSYNEVGLALDNAYREAIRLRASRHSKSVKT